MKALKVVIAVACLILGTSFAAAAQNNRPDYIYFRNVMELMPKYAEMQKSMEAYKKSFDDISKGMESEYASKVKEVDAKRAKMTDKQRTQADAELEELKDRMDKYKDLAQDKIQEKKDALTAPLLDKLITAIIDVAKEKGYKYVIDSSIGVTIAPATSDDFIADLKIKLRLK